MNKRTNIKNLLILLSCSLLLPLFSCSSNIENDNDNKAPLVKENESYKSYLIKAPNYDFYEFKHYQKEYGKPDYITPLEYHKTNKSYAGNPTVGQVRVFGENLDYRGYKTPIGDINYNLFAVSSSISFGLTFDPNITNKNVEIVDCQTYKVDNIDLKEHHRASIGKGTIIILKKHKNETNWQFVNQISAVDNSESVYEVDPQDILSGTYYRFSFAYQYREKDGWTFLHGSTYQYYDVLEHVNCYAVKNGNSIQFLTDYTDEHTFDLPTHKYENRDREAVKINSDKEVESFTPTDGNLNKVKNIASYSLSGEIIKASESNSSLEPNIPIYAYKGLKDLTINFKDKSKDISSNYSFFDCSETKEIITTHKYLNEDLTTNLPSLNERMLILEKENEGFDENNQYKYTWEQVEYISKPQDNLSIKLTRGNIADSKLFRLIYIVAVNKNDTDYILSEVSYFSVVNSSNSSFSNSYELEEGYDSKASMLELAANLNDESCCFSKFKCVNNVDSYIVEVSYNDQPFRKMIGDNEVFSDFGKYKFKVTNDLKEVEYTTIYLIDIGEDNGQSTFFEDGKFVSEKYRLYDPESRIPSYRVGAEFALKGSDFLPGLCGKISLVLADGTLREIQSFSNVHELLSGSFKEIGQYYVQITTNNETAVGDKIDYTIRFNVKDGSKYTPIVNYNLLHSGASSESLMGKIYDVKYKSKGDGSFIYVFPYTDNGYFEALSFAEKLESYGIETLDTIPVTYKYADKTYESKFDLYEDLSTNAKKKIESTYLNKIYDNYDFLKDYEIEDIENTTLRNNVFVVTDEDVFKELVSDVVYLNGFKFTQIREYETSRVELIDSNGKVTQMPYDVLCDDVLNESDLYTVREYNDNGVSEYKAAYIKNNTNLTTCTFEYITKDKERKSFDVSISHRVNLKSVSSVCFKNCFDKTDDSVLVRISYEKDPNISYYCLSLTELEGLIIDVNGKYTVTFINRFGYKYECNIEISGGKSTGNWIPHVDMANPLSYE